METILSQFDAYKYVDGVRKESFDEVCDKLNIPDKEKIKQKF